MSKRNEKPMCMVFCTEVDRAHYIYDGKLPPYLLRAPELSAPSEESTYFWKDKNGASLVTIEEAMRNPRVKVFKILGHKQRYQVVARIEYLLD